MFNSLTGVVTGCHEGTLCLSTAGGIEWSLLVAPGLGSSLEEGTTARVYTWLYHKEDRMEFYGFLSESERLFFLSLIKVSGVGPAAALKILSSAPLENLVSAITQGNASPLQAAKGIGAKAAQKIILQLRGALDPRLLELDSSAMRPVAAPFSFTGPEQDISQALVNMGFPLRDIESALPAIFEQNEGAEEEEILRLAIVALSSGGAHK